MATEWDIQHWGQVQTPPPPGVSWMGGGEGNYPFWGTENGIPYSGDWTEWRQLNASDYSRPDGLLDLSPTSKAWRAAGMGMVNRPWDAGDEAVRNKFLSSPGDAARFFINSGMTEDKRGLASDTLRANGITDENFIRAVDQQIQEINSRQHNEGSGIDWQMLLTGAGIAAGLGGFGALGGPAGGLDSSSATAASERTVGMWGAAPTAEATGGNMATGDWWDFGPSAEVNPGGAGTSDWWDFGSGSGVPTGFEDIPFGTTYPEFIDPDIINKLGSGVGKIIEKVGPQVAKSLFSKLMSEGFTSENMGALIGAVGPGLAQEFFASQRADRLSGSLTDIANRARADRSPFLDYARSTLAGGPEAYAAGPGAGALKGVLAKLSAGFGNPIGAPAALGIATDASLNNWGNDWRQAANIGLGGNYSQLATNAATAGAGTTGAGYGDVAAGLFTPQSDLASLLKRLQQSGLNLTNGLSLT